MRRSTLRPHLTGRAAAAADCKHAAKKGNIGFSRSGQFLILPLWRRRRRQLRHHAHGMCQDGPEATPITRVGSVRYSPTSVGSPTTLAPSRRRTCTSDRPSIRQSRFLRLIRARTGVVRHDRRHERAPWTVGDRGRHLKCENKFHRMKGHTKHEVKIHRS